MCGNYNMNAKDDNLKPDGNPAKDVIELGNSWKSEGDSDPGSVTSNLSPLTLYFRPGGYQLKLFLGQIMCYCTPECP